MLQNDILRRLRFALSLDNQATITVFKLVDYELEDNYLMSMMRREEEPGFTPCRDKILGLFLDGLIIKNRGRQEGVTPRPLKAGEILSNNDILRKIKIAMNYQQEDMLNILRAADFLIGKSELTALFRKPDHRSYRPCGDQLLRNFLQGMVKLNRPDAK
ncbi:DUF1456 family protein [Lacimicrobium alkaliphilum]|uniref:DUF1456 domain-containing protein n=1 Tax=Lacimicrobium alkaliphilum TaxID=1526571 RepID=A0ABQ1RM22_9ALTE|nr:DUF1456 family protein [Lacimicrobium alkaliphilum]GGD70891.1 DUF1456 domain-containing protein [Lacimicrobium alkaliphilum]